ncbi:hypothetical protein JW926_04180 [Candidatus Sumerlaeota bacterium]|nr:hypothetical protein [Candidatus Sumerlaeota bacterium]
MIKLKKNKTATLGILLFLALLASAFCLGASESYIKNGDFEKGKIFPEGWIVPQGSFVKFIWADPAHKRVLELNAIDSSTTSVITYESPIIDIDNGRDFILEAEIKTLNADLCITIVGYGDVLGQKKPVYRTMSVISSDNGSWRKIHRRFRPSCRNFKVKSFQITFSSSGSPGRIYIDNIRLVPAEVSPEENPEEAAKPCETKTDSPLA